MQFPTGDIVRDSPMRGLNRCDSGTNGKVRMEGEIYETIEDIWPDYPTKDDFFFNEEEY